MSDNNGSAPAGNPAPAAGTSTAAPAAPWYGNDLDQETAQWVQSKGIPDIKTALNSHRNLEKLLGADKAGRAIVPPKDDATPEDWQAFYGKLGRPEKPDGYKLPVPEGDSGEFAKTAANWFHEAGLTPKQAETLAAKWSEHMGMTSQQHQETLAQKAEIDIQDLKKAWGSEFEAKSEMARRAIREAGLKPEEAMAIERALGVKKAAEVFSFLGKQFAEAPMKGGEGQRGTFGMTPQDAMAKIKSLQQDQAWTVKYISGDTAARQEFDRLHKIAYPDVA